MKSKAYWVKRAVEVETYLQSQADSVKDGVIKAYERAIKNVNNDIEKTFKAYISTDIPEKEARRLMSIADSDKQYEELLELYDETDDKTVKKEILNRINAQAYGARISRLEGLKRNVYIYFRHVANEAIKEQKKLYDSAVKTAYYTNIFDTAQGLNCGIDFSLVPQKAVNKVLSEPWHGHNYSERVWIHNDRFIQAVGQTIEDGIISGHSVSRMTDKLIDYVKDTAPGGIRTSAETLVRSETAHFMNQGQKMAYEEIGIKQYRFVAALSELTCDRCGSLDGSVFDTDKAVEGENFPPIHPRCRCVTIMADVNLTSRIARDPLTGENYKVDGSMTFDEWKNSLSDEQKNALELHVKQMRNRSADKVQYEKYSQIFGKEFPKTLDAFVDMKYNDSDRWEQFKSEKQECLNQMDFKDMNGLIGKLGNKEARLWYKAHDENIPNLIDKTQTLEQQARQACTLRNTNRTNTRDLMKDQKLRKELDMKYPNLPYEFYYKKYKTDKETGKIYSDDEVNKKIIEKSTTTNKKADEKAGVDR
jgi:SPP1 gp7 family putative phage head morphogenesis protein